MLKGHKPQLICSARNTSFTTQYMEIHGLDARQQDSCVQETGHRVTDRLYRILSDFKKSWGPKAIKHTTGTLRLEPHGY
jgi:hypothetical protein